MNLPIKTPIELLSDWQKGIRIWHMAHARSSTLYEKYSRILGVSVIIISAIVGTSIFADLSASLSDAWKFITGGLSALAIILASIQTFMNYSELAEKHRIASQKYGALRRLVEDHLSTPPADMDTVLGEVRAEWDAIEQESPNVPQRIYDQSRADVHQRMAQQENSQA